VNVTPSGASGIAAFKRDLSNDAFLRLPEMPISFVIRFHPLFSQKMVRKAKKYRWKSRKTMLPA
jgi:hypothetical protein